MESCPSWSKEHDWKSCKPQTRLRGFESLALRHKKPNASALGFLSSENHVTVAWLSDDNKER